ncbi:MAG: glycosyltransferase [Pseudomonadota bacterium]
MKTVSLILPVLNEAVALPATLKSVRSLDPPPDEVLIIDGGSTDDSIDIARAASVRVILSPKRGRGIQINLGVSQASCDVICILHADSILPPDAVAVIRQTMAQEDIALASFMPRIAGQGGTRWGSTFHNWLKTWYIPMLFRPFLFIRGVRLLYGDHAMFFRRQQFLAIGGCDEQSQVMEEADLCIKLSRFGRTRIVKKWVWTSDRRIAAWGRWRANWIYLKVGVLWALGARERLADHYPDVR